jgi:hypothetical protein
MKRFESHVLHINRRKANWIGHTVSRKCLLKHVTEGKMRGEGRTDLTTRKKT